MNTNTEKTEVIQQVALAKIRPDPKNRKDHDKAKIKSLAESIASTGLLQPIIVRRSPDKATGTDYIILAGERRWLAHKELKAETILARVVESTTPTEEKLQNVAARAVENLQRENLTAIEEAEVYSQLAESGHSQEAIAKIANKSQPEVANTIGLLKLPPKVRELVANGTLSAAHGKTLGRFKRWPKVCEIIALDVVKEEMSSRALEEEVLPCGWYLKDKKLVIEINTLFCSWSNEIAYVIPPELQKDPDFLKDGDTWWCFAPEKWAPHKATQDKAHAEKKKKSDKSEGWRQSKMTPAEKAGRKKKIAENKRRREETADRLAAADVRLAQVKDYDAAAIRVLVSWVWNDFGDEDFQTAAKAAGVSLPKKLNGNAPDGLMVMKPEDLVRVTALALARRRAAEAVRWSSECPDEIAHLAGKEKTPVKSAEVIVMLSSHDNRARCGSATASCTSSPADAARQAASKYFGCKAELVQVKSKQAGSVGGKPAIYLAMKGGVK